MACKFCVFLATVGIVSASGISGSGLLAGPVGYANLGGQIGYAGNLGYAGGLGLTSGKLLSSPGLLAAGLVGYSGDLALGSGYAGLGLAGPGPIGLASPAFAVGAPAVVPAAIQSVHNVATYDVPTTGFVQPITVDVPANVLPMNFVFRSASSQINVAAKHEGAKGSIKETSSQDEPHVLKHTVTKPIIQEVTEIISPFRRIQQTIEPVREEVQTVVARGVGSAVGAGAGFSTGAGLVAAPAALAVDGGAVAVESAGLLAGPACGDGLGCGSAGLGIGLGLGGVALNGGAISPATYKTGGTLLAGQALAGPAVYKSGAALAAPMGYASKGLKAW